MPFQIDRTKSPIQNFTDLLNTVSSYTFSVNDFDIGNPEVYTPSGQETSNTSIVVSGNIDNGFTGSKTLKYRRLEIGHTRTAAVSQFQVELSDDADSVKEMIAEEHNLQISQINLVGSLPTPGGSNTTCTIQSITNSLLYYGQMNVTLLAPAAPPPPSNNYSVRLRTLLQDMIHASAYTAAVSDITGRGGSIDATSIGPGMTLSETDTVVASSGSVCSCIGTTNSLVPNGIVCEWEVITSTEAQMSVGFLSGSGSYSNSDFRAGDNNFPGPFGTWYDSDGQGVAAGQGGLSLPTYTEGDVIGIINRSGVGTLFFKNGVQVLAAGNQLNFPRAVISFEAT